MARKKTLNPTDYHPVSIRVPMPLWDRFFTWHKHREMNEGKRVMMAKIIAEALDEYLAKRGA